MKPKKCRHCKTLFTPSRPIQVACSIACAVAMARKKRDKVEKANDRQRKEELQPIQYKLSKKMCVGHPASRWWTMIA